MATELILSVEEAWIQIRIAIYEAVKIEDMRNEECSLYFLLSWHNDTQCDKALWNLIRIHCSAYPSNGGSIFKEKALLTLA
ncbi:unnamed protein product [Peronospora belbahrii]|uniref:HAT C-terminal dimerisation domain-containing protein n=1 Tax=Peronospora belbahrii TaxID=622444 RepID=A0ABN8CTZ5_9STRA|nr:unnamed protein product [Peronospora belbahrii]